MTGPVWIGASHVLGRPVPLADPYPHICNLPLFSPKTGQRVLEKIPAGDLKPVTLWRRDCAACADDAHQKRVASSTQPPAA